MKKICISLIVLSLCSALLFSTAVQAEEPVEEETEGIFLELTNRTGKDIVSFALKDISAWPDEDFSEELAEQGLIEGDVFAADQTMVLENIMIERPEEEKENTEISEEQKAFQDLLKEYEFETEYYGAFQLENDADAPVYVFHVFIPEEAYNTELFLEGDIAWLEYTVKDSEDVISTREIEEAIHKMQEEQGEREIVSQVAFPNCDDESHGYYEITYSDGSVEYVEY